jgi:hypothetical protein
LLSALCCFKSRNPSLIDGLKFTTLTGAQRNADQTRIYFRCYNKEDLEMGKLGLLNIPEAQMVILDRKGQEIRFFSL